jgi:hypothetical protein
MYVMHTGFMYALMWASRHELYAGKKHKKIITGIIH